MSHLLFFNRNMLLVTFLSHLNLSNLIARLCFPGAITISQITRFIAGMFWYELSSVLAVVFLNRIEVYTIITYHCPHCYFFSFPMFVQDHHVPASHQGHKVIPILHFNWTLVTVIPFEDHTGGLLRMTSIWYSQTILC